MSDHLLEDELLEAVRRARPGLPGEELSASGVEAQAVLDRVLAVRRPRRRAALRWARRAAPVAVAVAATVLVAVAAIVSLRAHTPSGAGRGGGVVAGVSGRVVDRDGRVLAGELGARLKSFYAPRLTRGTTLQTSLDPALERAGLLALQRAVDENPPASGGGFVALDPRNGQVYALGSIPTGLTGGPRADRVIGAAGSVGSTFAPITALAALQSGAWSVGHEFDDTGQFCFEDQCRHNGGAAVDGVLDLERALAVSSNDFFYNLGVLTNSSSPAGGALQAWARALGIGVPTGVDLSGEDPGTLPTPAWLGRHERSGAADGTHRPWSAGDNENLAVGQGDVQVTPLQVAVAYAAIANGGTVVRPHLGKDVERRDGTVLQTIDPPPVRRLHIDPAYLEAVRVGLRAASSQPGGSSADVFARFPEPVYGETGSARHVGLQDYAWYAGFVPASATSRPLVVVVAVEQGGFGAAAAAPVARQIFSQWFLGRPGPWVLGASRTL